MLGWGNFWAWQMVEYPGLGFTIAVEERPNMRPLPRAPHGLETRDSEPHLKWVWPNHSARELPDLPLP